MNTPGNRGSIQLRNLNNGPGNNNRGSINLERSGLMQHQTDNEDNIQHLQQMDLSAFFAPPPTRWEQSENICDYFYLLYADCVDWWENVNWQEIRDSIVYFLDKFAISITVSVLKVIFIFCTIL